MLQSISDCRLAVQVKKVAHDYAAVNDTIMSLISRNIYCEKRSTLEKHSNI